MLIGFALQPLVPKELSKHDFFAQVLSKPADFLICASGTA
jgi:hypothetical protein